MLVSKNLRQFCAMLYYLKYHTLSVFLWRQKNLDVYIALQHIRRMDCVSNLRDYLALTKHSVFLGKFPTTQNRDGL